MPDFPLGRLADALLDPREHLDFEVKNWLDLVNDNDAKANLAKAALALANHGGGLIILGMTETANGVEEAEDRPATLDGYAQDLINGIVHHYADPPFHCEVHVRPDPSGALFPIVVVPGGHRIPIRCKRAGPNGQTITNNAIYIRRPGPRSEVPQSAQDWNDLLGRCLTNRRDEMFDQIRALITGAVPAAAAPPQPARLDLWIEQSLARWQVLTGQLPADDPARCPHGYMCFAFEIDGTLRNLTGAAFSEALRSAEVNFSGWPPFWYPTRAGIAPYPVDGLVECWIGGDSDDGFGSHAAADSDFWRISPDGFAFLLRGYREDDLRGEAPGRAPVVPGTKLELTWPVSVTGEVLLYAESLARRLVEGPAMVTLAARYTGLAGRSLFSLGGRRALYDRRAARQEEITLRTSVDIEAINPNLNEIVHPFLMPLYALFDFFDLPPAVVADVLGELRRRQNR